MPVESRSSSVALFRATADVWNQFRAGWRALPPAARRRWWLVVFVGLVLCDVLVALLTWGVWRWEQGGSLAWEADALRRLEQFAPLDLQRAIFFQALGATPFLVVLIIVLVVRESRAGRPLRALSLPVGFLGSKILSTTGWLIWSRARPQLILEGVLNPPLHSFPSGHAVQSVVIFGLLTWFWVTASRSRAEQAVAWALCAVLVGLINVSRLRMGAHWPSDVLAGLLIGTAWLTALILALPRTPHRESQRDVSQRR